MHQIQFYFVLLVAILVPWFWVDNLVDKGVFRFTTKKQRIISVNCRGNDMRPVAVDLGVAAVVVNNNAILLVKEAFGPYAGRWGLPKGMVESNELPAHAVLRELHEECGLEASIIGVGGIREYQNVERCGILISYILHTNDFDITIDGEEISQAGYFEIDSFSEIKWISPSMKDLARTGLQNQFMLETLDKSFEMNRPYLLHLNSHTQESLEVLA